MLSKAPGICEQRLNKILQEHENKSWLAQLFTPKYGRFLAGEAAATEFKRLCEQLPQQMPESMLNEMRQRLIDYGDGRYFMSPEEALRLRSHLSLLEDAYRPGPRFEGPITEVEEAWLTERNLKFSNDLAIALLGPLFDAPGANTRIAGCSEQSVATANEPGAIGFEFAGRSCEYSKAERRRSHKKRAFASRCGCQ